MEFYFKEITEFTVILFTKRQASLPVVTFSLKCAIYRRKTALHTRLSNDIR